jgi:hypothetical protein
LRVASMAAILLCKPPPTNSKWQWNESYFPTTFHDLRFQISSNQQMTKSVRLKLIPINVQKSRITFVLQRAIISNAARSWCKTNGSWSRPQDAVNSAPSCLNRLQFSIHYFLQLVIGNVRQKETGKWTKLHNGEFHNL